MSSRSTRYPSRALGDVESGGRHRRPESLAEVTGSHATITARRAPAAESESALAESPSTAAESHAAAGVVLPLPRREEDTPAADRPTRASRRRAATTGQATATGTGRHAHVVARETAARWPPATGSHRAPGTLPIESWLLFGQKRQQILLASLVAIALLVVAVPASHGGMDAVNAAAAGAIGGRVAAKQTKNDKTAAKQTAPSADKAAGKSTPAPEPSVTTTPAAKPSPTVSALPAGGGGPGHSLRTTGTQAIALTFDDGPDPLHTPAMLALLRQYHIKATFCLIGENVRKHPEIVREIVADGHTLCNHTWEHSLTIGKDSPDKIKADLAKTNAAIEAAAPGAPIPFFRAPGGNFSDRLVQVAAQSGMKSLYWQVDPADWDHPKGESDAAHVQRVMSVIRKNVQPGSIILSHDFNQPDTLAAYTKLMPWLTQNYTIGIPGGPVSSTPSPTAPASSAPAAQPSDTATPDPGTTVTAPDSAPRNDDADDH